MSGRSASYARSVSRGRSFTRSPLPPSDNARSRSRSPPRRSISPPRRNGTKRTRSPSRSLSRSRSRSPRRSRSRTSYRRRSYSRSPSRSTSPLPRSAKIVIEKLTKNVLATHLHEIFSSYGAIVDVDMPMNRQFQTNRGTAYVLFASPASAESAIAHMHEAQLDGAQINVSIVLPRRRFSRSPPAKRPPPRGFGEPHRYREQAQGRGPPPGRRGGGRLLDEYVPPPRGARGGDRRPRSLSRSRTRDRSLSRSPPPRRGARHSPPRGGGGRRRRSPSYSSYGRGSPSRSRSRSRSRTRSRSPSRGGRRRQS
ncbi:hypothetical protein MBLNU457_4025t2 [Dothideomycetes sp. NU457]